MKHPKTTVVVIIVILALVIGLLANLVSWKEITVPMPLKGEAAINPFYAAEQLVRKLGARAEHRRSLGLLPPADAVIVCPSGTGA